ncbi:FtsK/SpoIIIE domain-containing protein [Kitasatospora purpeofusca]|uniref:FtsK/SpoIIIE domain-containing protein n=1 Tax=Kitasatospora purpeofusca TaxID=67352 RepID=UPI00225608DC|nr:FtsK/SpoIIIE domain-containing protein [Kitasatospora purpeofusca]MCX4689532.1 FtsK/SpoIIIE domain-containing protein [Kitasatospora purpeofusca]
MKLTVTVADGTDRRDHVLDLPPGATVGELAAALDRREPDPAAAVGSAGPGFDPGPPGGDVEAFLAGTGAAAPRGLHVGPRRLDPGTPVARAGVREGAVLGLGAPADEPDRVRSSAPDRRPDDPVQLELHLVSGPGAGRIWRLGPGSHEIGTDPSCTVRLRGSGVPEGGLWLTVGPDGSAGWHRAPVGPARPDAPGSVAGGTPPPEEGDEAVALRIPSPPATDRTDRTGTDRTGTDRTGADHPATGERGTAPDRRARRTGRNAPHPASHRTDGRTHGGTAWPLGADLTVGTVLLRLVEPTEPDAAVVPSADGIGVDYNRPPRIVPHLDAERIRLPLPPTAPSRRPFPLLLMLAPIVLGMVMVAVFQSYFYLVFILFSPLMAVSNWIVGRRGNRKQHEEAVARYEARRRVLEQEVRTAADRERRVRGVAGPDPATVALTATGPGGRLWERRRHDPDHLVLRIGTVDQPSVKEIDDPARDENHRLVRWSIPDVPIGIEVAEFGVVGVAGTEASVQALARWLVAQSAVLHSPRDLRVVVLSDRSRADGWAWVRWLPHLRPSGGGAGPVVAVGNDPESTANRISELVAQIQARRRVLGSSMGKAMFNEPDVLVIADGARQLRDVPGMVQVLTDGPGVRVFSVCLDAQERLLPEECGTVVLAAGHRLTVRRTGAPDLTEVRADLVGAGWCEQVARALAPVRDVSPEHDAGLPQLVRLLDLLRLEPPDPATLLARWRRRPAATSFVLGTGYDGPLTLDLVRDGPHALVAGTTGSGKSELLQSFVASLAAANRPDELTFVLVDYKGGSAFRECAELPHTLGMVTDLDAHLVERALESLGAELRRRERLLADVAAKDHPEYRSKRVADPTLPPLPRLLLVIDEFATLVREVPDFVPGLIGIAQRGRSLGIHLVLATQRPSGAVTSDIRANTNLRIALRVTDSTESQDIIDTSEAVHIPASAPGRALVRLGHRSTVPFQSAWAGAARPDAAGAAAAERPRGPVRATGLSWTGLGRPLALPLAAGDPAAPAAPVPTDLQALVAAAREAAAALDDFTPQPSPWLPALPEEVQLDEVTALLPTPGDAALPVVPYALEDVPQLQQRRVATVDLASFGHLYVIGAPRSGRTQVLRTLAGSVARTTSCADVHLYGIDAAGGGLAALNALPHCGAVVSRHDQERLERLLHRLTAELTRRQELCSERNAAGLNELRAALPKPERPAHILLLIDGWDALSGLLDDHDNGRLADLVTRLLREGAAAGIHVVATSERSLLGGRLAAHNDHKLLLRQGDRNDYQLVGLSPSKVPAGIPAGRGWHTLSGTETQVALLAPGAGGREQARALAAIGAESTRRDSAVPAGLRPFPVAALPRSVDFAEAYAAVPEESRRPLWGLLGLGGDDAGPVGVDLAGAAAAFAVLGPPGSGRSTALASLAVSLLAGGTGLVVLAPRHSPLRALARHAGARVLTDADPSAQDVQAALDALTGPRVVVVDDADLLAAPACDRVLKEVAAFGRDRGLGLLYAGSADALQLAMGSWLSAAKRARRGLLLGPKSLQEGDMIGVRLPVHLIRATPVAGRGWTTGRGGEAMAVQVPLTVLRTED